jgi:hypothetical protein
MIDIGGVAANALWILGLSLILAALSWANWVAARERIPFRRALGRPGVRRAVDGGLMLFCAGLAATGRTGWERALWGVLAAGCGALAIWEEWMGRRKDGRGVHPELHTGSPVETAGVEGTGDEE